MSVFKDFPDLENLEKKNSRTFKDFQGPVRALYRPIITVSGVSSIGGDFRHTEIY